MWALNIFGSWDLVSAIEEQSASQALAELFITINNCQRQPRNVNWYTYCHGPISVLGLGSGSVWYSFQLTAHLKGPKPPTDLRWLRRTLTSHLLGWVQQLLRLQLLQQHQLQQLMTTWCHIVFVLPQSISALHCS